MAPMSVTAAEQPTGAAPQRSSLPTRPVLATAATVTVVLTLLSGRYGLHRDELYFTSLAPAWGYVDQPPLLPLIGHLLGPNPWLLRAVATAATVASVLLVTLIARELGAGPRAQAWTAWAYSGTTAVLSFGHVLLTTTVDIVAWLLVCLLVIRAELGHRPRLWLVAGVVAGLATYAKLLIAVLLVGLAVGLLVTGRWRRLLSTPVLGGAALAALVGAPNLVYQVVNGLPQLEMGQALSQNDPVAVRVFAPFFLLLVLGPVLVPVWGRGLLALWRRPDWSPIRLLVPAFVLLVVFTLVSGAQPYYPMMLLGVLFAAGMADRGEASFGRPWRVAVAVNAAVSAFFSLPLLPLTVAGQPVLGASPVPPANQLIADQVGWPTYAAQVEAVYRALPPAPGSAPVVLASNYGEAGAIRAHTDLPVVSGHNALGDHLPPPEQADVVVVVGGQAERADQWFTACRLAGRLDNGVDVPNEGQGQPIVVCRGLRAPWPVLWPQIRHLD